MYRTDADPTGSERLLPTLQKELAVLAASLDGHFLQAGTTLATAIETVDRVIVALDGVTGALDEKAAGAAVRDLRAVAERLAQLPRTQAVREAALTTVAGTTKALRAGVMEMHQTLHLLRIYGANVGIAASGADMFGDFVSGMTETLRAGEQEVEAFLATLKDLDASLASAQQGERILAAECVKVVPAVPDALGEDAAALQAHLAAVADAAQMVGSVARDIQGRVAIVLGALQVGDSTRQRLEHIVSALQILDGRALLEPADPAADTAIVGHISGLLAAQLDAIATDFDRETRLLLASLTALGPDTQRLLTLIERNDDENARTFLHRLERGITEVELLTSQLHQADQRSGVMTDMIATALDALAIRVDSLETIRRDVQTIATDTQRLCGQAGDTGKAVSVIATEVDTHTSRLASALAGIARPIDALGEVRQSMRDAQRDAGALDAGDALSGALDSIRKACRQSNSSMTEGRDDAQQVIAIIDGTSGNLARELALSDGMKNAGARLAAFATVDAVLPDAADATLRALLVTIGGLYTMAQERHVHAGYLLPGMEPAVGMPAGSDGLSDDDDDDGLF